MDASSYAIASQNTLMPGHAALIGLLGYATVTLPDGTSVSENVYKRHICTLRNRRKLRTNWPR
jgi:hypothetical protein